MSTNTLTVEEKKDIFWDMMCKHEVVIKKCFNYLIKRFPNFGGKENVYNYMVIKLWELDVMFRFDIKKVLSKKINLPEELISDEYITEEKLKEYGINYSKKFEQYLFKWVEQALGSYYKNENKYYKRYRLNYNENIPYKKESSWGKNSEHTNKRGIAPANGSFDAFNGSKFLYTQDSLLEGELACALRKGLESEDDKKIFNMLLLGFNNKDIHKEFSHMSYQNLWLKINKLKNKLRPLYKTVVKS